jgi:TatA/E family protein of Tat protein translocase
VGLSIWHVLIVLVIVLVFFGPKRLPDLGRSLGEAINGFKKGLNGNEIDVTQSSEKLDAKKDPNQANAGPQNTTPQNTTPQNTKDPTKS